MAGMMEGWLTFWPLTMALHAPAPNVNFLSARASTSGGQEPGGRRAQSSYSAKIGMLFVGVGNLMWSNPNKGGIWHTTAGRLHSPDPRHPTTTSPYYPMNSQPLTSS